MSTYAKTAPGENLTYRPVDLRDYEGEQFCLRITLDDVELERCFFVYIDEEFEDYSLRKLFVTYFIAPGPEQEPSCRPGSTPGSASTRCCRRS